MSSPAQGMANPVEAMAGLNARLYGTPAPTPDVVRDYPVRSGFQNPFGQSLQGGRGQFQAPQSFGGGQQNFGFGQPMNYSPFSGGLGSLYGNMGGFGGYGGYGGFGGGFGGGFDGYGGGMGGYNPMMGGLGGFGFNPMMGYGGMGGFGGGFGGFGGFGGGMGGYNPFFGGIGGLGQNSYFNQRMPPQGQFQFGYGESPSSVPTPMPGMKQPADETPEARARRMYASPRSHQDIERLVEERYGPQRQYGFGEMRSAVYTEADQYRDELNKQLGAYMRREPQQQPTARDMRMGYSPPNPYTDSMMTMDRPPPSMTTPEQRMKQREQMRAMQNLATQQQSPNLPAPSSETNPFASSYETQYI